MCLGSVDQKMKLISSLLLSFFTGSHFEAQEAAVLRAFTLPTLRSIDHSSDPSLDPNWAQFFTFDPNMSSTRMLQLGCVVRSVGVALSSRTYPHFKFLFDALTRPTTLAGVFLPTMPSDTRLAMMMEIMIMGRGMVERG